MLLKLMKHIKYDYYKSNTRLFKYMSYNFMTQIMAKKEKQDLVSQTVLFFFYKKSDYFCLKI